MYHLYLHHLLVPIRMPPFLMPSPILFNTHQPPTRPQVDNQSSADFSGVRLVLERRQLFKDYVYHSKDMTECVVQSAHPGNADEVSHCRAECNVQQ
jgi:hypothetical protein